MTGSAALARVAREGADSVFRYVERSAEPIEGGVRWRARDSAGGPQYRGDLYSNGGIPLAWLKLYEASGDAVHLVRACEVGERVARHRLGPDTGFSGGAAGHGTLLLRLWERTRDERSLSAALACAAWLEDVALPNERAQGGVYWRISATDPESAVRTPLYAGIAGTAYFLLLAYELTREQRWERLARAAALTLVAEARPDRGGLNWLPEIGATHDADLDWQRIPIGEGLARCQWCSGAPGVGLFFSKAYELLGDEQFLDVAETAGEATYAYDDGRANPTYCHGLAGNTELLIELARVAPQPRSALWLERAHEHARRLLGYRREGLGGEWWPSDDPVLDAPDLLCGAAGTGHVFLRLLGLAEGKPVRMALL